MTKFSVRMLAVASIAVLSACNGASYKKTSSGLMYKVIGSGSGNTVKPGQILKLNYIQKINDSVLTSSYDKMPAYAKVDSAAEGQYNPAEIFHLLRKGDSAVVVQMVDTIMKKSPMGLPPFMKKGDKLTLTLKVVEVFDTDELAKVDGDKEMEKEQARMEKESASKSVESLKEVETYLGSKKITAQKTGKGTYVEIKTQGTGAQAEAGKFVSVRYTGISMLSGKEFENNVGADKQAFTFQLGSGQVIPGWDEGIQLLKKGAKATLYIPGSLAYGPRPGPGGTTFESLIFHVELEDVLDTMPQEQPHAGH